MDWIGGNSQVVVESTDLGLLSTCIIVLVPCLESQCTGMIIVCTGFSVLMT